MTSRKIRIGVIPAAGAGLRTGHLGKILPKCLFPLYDKPLLYYIIQNMKKVGVERVYIIVNYQKEMVVDYINEIEGNLGLKIDFIVQPRLRGIAEAIELTKKYIREPFLVILGDDVTLTDSLTNLLDVFFKNNAVVVEGIVREKKIHLLRKTCCVEVKRNKMISRIQEKPKRPFSNLRGIGIYVFNPSIYDYIKKIPVSFTRNEKEITNTIQLAAKDGNAYGELINGVNVNVNGYDDLLQAWLIMKKYKIRKIY